MIDDKLAEGLARRYSREMRRAREQWTRHIDRECLSRRPTFESRIRSIDRLLEETYSKYVVTKLLLLDKRRSLVDAVIILPSPDERDVILGSFVLARLRMSYSKVEMSPLMFRSSLHWTRRVFKRLGSYDPLFVRQEIRCAFIGMAALSGLSGSQYREIPSRAGVSVISTKEEMVDAITYMTDAQASEEQELRWRQTRQLISERLGLSSWNEVMEFAQRVDWIGARKQRVLEIRPKVPWLRENGQQVLSRDSGLPDTVFLGVVGQPSSRTIDSKTRGVSPPPASARLHGRICGIPRAHPTCHGVAVERMIG